MDVALRFAAKEFAEVRQAAARAGKPVQSFAHGAVLDAARRRDRLLASIVKEDAVALERVARD